MVVCDIANHSSVPLSLYNSSFIPSNPNVFSAHTYSSLPLFFSYESLSPSATMEFWGTEVKSGQTFDVNLGEGKVLHLSQACIGEIKKETKDSVCLHITVGDKKLVLGTLHTERLPQQLFDLVFDKDFKISHNWKNGSVYFYGYKADQPIDEHDESEDFESEDEEEELPLPVANGKPEVKKEEKAVVGGKKDGNAKASAAGKQKVKIVEPEKDEKDSDDEDDSDDSDAMLEDSDDDDEDNDDSSDDEEDSDEEEETPKKQESGKKRAKDSATKTPQPEKKSKLTATPQKTEGKKGGAVHIATPHPSKQAAAKTPGGGNKSNQKSPASAADGAHSCKSCNRNFKTEGALSSHNQAKHTSK